MKTQFMKLALGIMLSGAVLTSCKKDDPEEPNDEEVITTMKLTFVPVGGGTTLTYQFKDPDGAGGTAPTQDEIVLAPAKSYNVTVQLLNETVTPAEDITTEVSAEADAHRFYYEPTAGSNITVGNLDNDGNGVPLGITSTWTSGAVATGKLKVTLRHYAGTPPGKALADPVNSSKSSSDIEVEFNTKIQ
ncbi:MAG: hypothetical protein JNM14_02600 [Ferruginibacter sp.]|nr:hypothetical protein [Ferruginibacter sp.]